MIDAHLSNARLNVAGLTDARLFGAPLDEATLRYACLSGVILILVSLRDATPGVNHFILWAEPASLRPGHKEKPSIGLAPAKGLRNETHVQLRNKSAMK